MIRSQDAASRKDLATKGDIQDVCLEMQTMRVEMQENKHELLKWMVTGMIAQTALLVGLLAYMK